MAEDNPYQFVEVGGGELHVQGTVRGDGCLLRGMPDLFGNPRGDSGGKAEFHAAGIAALHDAEMLAGVFFEGGKVGGDGNCSVRRSDLADAGKGKITQALACIAPGEEVPAAHIVQKMERLDGPRCGGTPVRGMVGDVQGLVCKQGLNGLPEGAGVDPGIFDVFHRDLRFHLLQAGLLVFAGDAGHPVDHPAQVIFQGRVGDGRGETDGKRQGEDVGFADPMAGDFIGGIGIAKAAARAVIGEWGVDPLAHEFDVAIGRSLGDFEFLRQVTGIRKFSGLDPAMKPTHPFVLLPVGHLSLP